MKHKKKSSPKAVWFISGFVVVGLLGGIGFLVNLMMSEDGPKRKNQVSTVNLLKPPPPPVVKEKPPEPEPEIKKKQEVKEIVDAGPEKSRPDEPKSDDKPPGKQLGVDSEGTAGSDSFGLVGNKGGSALIGGGGGGSSLFQKYGWYNQMLQDELHRRVRKKLDENGGIPKTKLQTIVQITLDSRGKIKHYQIISSSGDRKMDSAVEEALRVTTISQPPPEGMPKGMKIRISSQG
ncbi:MAG: TonB family protein [Syntrophobacteraceae bacterium]